MNRQHRLAACAVAGLAIGAMPAGAQDADALAACQLIGDSAERLECYDAALQPEPAPEPEPPAEYSPPPDPAPSAEPAAPAAAPVRELDDEVAKEAVTNEKRDTLAARGRLARCQQGRSGKYVFWFENGQVWRQKGGVTPRWKECNFEVTIGKDVFGYTMTRDGDDRKYRVERVE